ncbi:MAG: RadC family protein [Clostridia bacterium]|nr:RadC family protein [Clostridia bacterium]
MGNGENVHAGHRERLIGKFLKDSESFLPHELLEMLLFHVLPRKNTNDIAHALLRTFGTLDKVFCATAEELKTVDGVGDKVAAFIILFGALMKATAKKCDVKVEKLNSFSAVKSAVGKYFEGLKEEKLFLFLLKKNHEVITKIEFADQENSKVTADISEIAKAFALHKPAYVIIAHNHPSGDFEPSKQDDFTTENVNVLCEIHGVALVDHIIYTENQIYSYHDSGRLEKIKEVAGLKKLLRHKGE